MVLMPGFQSTRLVTEGALEPFFFLYTDDSIQGNTETCKQSSIMLNYEVKNTDRVCLVRLRWKKLIVRHAYYNDCQQNQSMERSDMGFLPDVASESGKEK